LESKKLRGGHIGPFEHNQQYGQLCVEKQLIEKMWNSKNGGGKERRKWNPSKVLKGNSSKRTKISFDPGSSVLSHPRAQRESLAARFDKKTSQGRKTGGGGKKRADTLACATREWESLGSNLSGKFERQ